MYILSTLTSDNCVCLTKTLTNGTTVIVRKLLIRGGANVKDKKTLITPHGTVTEVTDEEWGILKKTDWWKRMEQGGWVKVVETKAAAERPKEEGLNDKDKSAQATKEEIAKMPDAEEGK